MNANLLIDDVFGIRLPSGERQSLSLPALLQALGRGEVESFTGIQRHQADAFHIFLCYLAGTVLDREGESSPIQDEAFWLAGLRRLTGRDDDDAWMLVVEDPARPAFMQPPLPNVEFLSTFSGKYITPDGIDILQLAKNHDRKGARGSSSPTEAWVYALITMQSLSGYLGGKREVARMNTGRGSRVCVETIRTYQISGRWNQDVGRLLGHIEDLLPPHKPYRRDGHVLLWTLPWDGETSLAIDSLHPFYIEVARLVRLQFDGTSIVALDRRTSVGRIEAKSLKGNVGDPWIPIHAEKSSALTVTERGFTAQLLRDLILGTGKYIPAAMQSLDRDEREAWFHASVLVRGQGTTDGYHEARIYIVPRAKNLLLQHGEALDRLGKLSDWALTRARDVRSKALRPALFALVEGGPEQWPDTNRREAGHWVDSWLARYDQHWASGYFPWLWRTIDQADESARAEWLCELQALAMSVLEDALQTAPQRTGRRYRGKVRATGLFHGAFRRHFNQEMTNVAD